jgi:hypothetical protein
MICGTPLPRLGQEPVWAAGDWGSARACPGGDHRRYAHLASDPLQQAVNLIGSISKQHWLSRAEGVTDMHNEELNRNHSPKGWGDSH